MRYSCTVSWACTTCANVSGVAKATPRIPAPGGVKASSCGHSTTTAVSGKAARASSTPAHICSLVSARSNQRFRRFSAAEQAVRQKVRQIIRAQHREHRHDDQHHSAQHFMHLRFP